MALSLQKSSAFYPFHLSINPHSPSLFTAQFANRTSGDSGKGLWFIKKVCSFTISFRVELDPSIPDIPAEDGQLAQVFLNLIRNGAEAMNGEGELVISTKDIFRVSD
jgi:signal transduction histidine kinase